MAAITMRSLCARIQGEEPGRLASHKTHHFALTYFFIMRSTLKHIFKQQIDFSVKHHLSMK